MLKLDVYSADNSWRITTAAGEQSDTLKELLDDHNIPLAGECGGAGKCGLCLVKIQRGDTSPLTLREQEILTGDELSQGYRLACQIQPHTGMALVISTGPIEA